MFFSNHQGGDEITNDYQQYNKYNSYGNQTYDKNFYDQISIDYTDDESSSISQRFDLCRKILSECKDFGRFIYLCKSYAIDS